MIRHSPLAAPPAVYEQAELDFLLPPKRTCTVPEAAHAANVSERLITYFVADGTLLAVDISRKSPIDEHSTRRHHRIVVRRDGARPPEADGETGLTLAEWVATRKSI